MSETFRTIVAAVDFSDTSEQAWRTACGLAAATGSHLHLLHVSPDPLQQGWAVEAIAIDFDAVAKEYRDKARERLSSLQAVAGLDESRITRAVVSGVPHAAITEYAAAQQADLIVVGTHGYGPLKHLLLGSVAERVARHACCPVMTVPPPTIAAARSAHQKQSADIHA